VTGHPADEGVVVRVAAPLRFLLPARDRTSGRRWSRFDPDATVGHVVQAAGVPLTEVGGLRLDGVGTDPHARARPGGVLDVATAPRPQPLPAGGFLLDVGLGTLARKLRLLGLDVAWSNDAADDELVQRAGAEDRVLLTQDRRLLMRRALGWAGQLGGAPTHGGRVHGALVRGSGAAAQLADVIDRFAPPIDPLTRCTACGGPLAPVPKADVVHLLEPGTRRSYDEFSRCASCGRVYWRGAHARRIEELVRRVGETGRAARG
jgi:hypothetical protein